MTKREEYIKANQYLFANKAIGIEEISPNKFLLKLEKQFEWKAGHVVAITTNESIAPRIYSICAGEKDENLQVLFDLKTDGMLTPIMAKLKQGTTIYVSKPYGSFLPETQKPMYWIATGTGIAPFYAMVRSGFRAIKLLHGARQGEHFYFERHFKETLMENYIRCNSGNDGLGDYFGRVTNYLENCNQLDKQCKYYLCGRAMMIVEVRDLLISKGIPYENIVSEIFF